MNKEQQELVGEAYDNYFGNFYKLPNNKKWMKEVFYSDGNSILHVYLREEFIKKCKTDIEFSQRWGLKIEERELSTEERNKWFQINLNGNNPLMKSDWKDYELDQKNTPTKLITITYNDTKIESYV